MENDYRFSSGLRVALAPIVISFSLYSVAARAQPTVAIAPQGEILPPDRALLDVNRARDLLRHSAGSAADLDYRPPLWEWTRPLAAPAQISQGSSATPDTPVGPLDAGTPTEDTDILDEVSVTATRRPTRQRDTTATTYTVTKADFQAQGATTVPDALLFVPGFVSQPALGGQRNFSANYLRGFDESRFLLLRDGLSLNASQDNRSNISGIPIEDLERIEVVTGGATLRYGSGSVGGVVNLITETPKGLPKLTLKYEAGTYGFSKYLAKYGGGDDTFSYNLVYTGLVAFNNFPFNFTLPNQASFYGPTTNPDARVAQSGFIDPGPDGANYPNGQNSFGVGGAGDSSNNGPVDLFGYLKPEVGPPITLKGVNDSSYNASDSYTAKLSFKPDTTNRLTLRLNQRNRKYDDQGLGGALGLGTYNIFGCYGGRTTASGNGADNGTLGGNRFLPLAPDGSEVPCNLQRGVIGTPTSQFALFNTAGPYAFNTSFDGQTVFPTGNSYPGAENLLSNVFLYTQRNSSESEVSLNWDMDLTPTTSLNSYAYYYRNAYTSFRPSPYSINTNIFGTGTGTANPLAVPPAPEPFSDGNKLELQTALNTQLSAGQTLALGVNFVQDRVYQVQQSQTSFVDQAISRSSVFIVDDISFSSNLKANLGFRYTYSTQFGSVGIPAAGIRYTPNQLVSLRANYSNVFNAPSLSDLFLRSSFFLPNPGIRPETGVTFDVGVDITPARNVGLRATYFNTYLDGAIGGVSFIQDGMFFFQQRNRNSRLADGIELQADWQITEQFRARAFWTNTTATPYGGVNSTDTTQLFFFQYQDPSIPYNNVVAALTYANQGLTATLLGRYNSGQRRLNSTLFTPDWATLDLNVEVPVTTNLTLTGNVFNLTDTHYEYFDGVPGPGITFRVGARLELGGA